jgi:hypothetical protein
VKEFMEHGRYEVVGIRSGGHVLGFVTRAELGDGPCSGYLRDFDESQVALDSTPLGELVLRLKDHHRLFVSILRGGR